MKPPSWVIQTYAHHLFSLHCFLFSTNSISNDLIFSSGSLMKGMRAAPWRFLLDKPLVAANAFQRSTNGAILNLFKNESALIFMYS